MTVKELITRLLDKPMNAEVELVTDDSSRDCRVSFHVDSVEHWNYTAYIKFSDWRDSKNKNED